MPSHTHYMFGLNSETSTDNIKDNKNSYVSFRGNISGGDYKYTIAADTASGTSATAGKTSSASSGSLVRPKSRSCKFIIKC